MSTSPDFEVLASGYGLIEGPRVDRENRLYFSDARNGGVYRRAPSGEVETVIPKRRGVGGIALHAAGGIVVSGKNICHVKDGESRVLFGREDIPGFNDLVTDAEGRILVGAIRSHAFWTGEPHVPGELFRIDAEGKATVLYDDVGMSNGIGRSPDGRRLYHNDSARNHVLVHDVAEDGGCTNRRVFTEAPRGVPDGLAVDEEGCVWIASYGGSCVMRFTPDGSLDRRLAVPAKIVTSLCFGGPSRRDLYVVTADNTGDPTLGGTIFRTRVDVPGLAVELAQV
jgi:gluconolactonase